MRVFFAVFSGALAFSLVSCASLNMDVASANMGQARAERLDGSRYDKQHAAYLKAEKNYLKGRDRELKKLEKKYPGFTADLMSADSARMENAAARLSAQDVGSAYWAGAGWLGAFSLDPLNDELLSTVVGAPVLLERAAALDGGYGNGAIYDVLIAWYAGAPAELGGDEEKAKSCFAEELRITEGKSPQPYVTWAVSWCRPRQDAAGFTEALETALALKPAGLMDKRAREKARWLLDSKENFFLFWDEE